MQKRRLTILFLFILCTAYSLTAFAATQQSGSIPKERQLPRLVDNADLLSANDKKAVLAKLDEISQRQQCDVAIVTVKSLGGKAATAYADDFYDYNGYGMGVNYDGILLLISMEQRDWAISTHGYALTVFTDAGQEYLTSKFLPYLSDAAYSDAFNTYAQLCDEFITQAKTTKPYDRDNLPQEPLDWVWIPISLTIGLIMAFFVTNSMKSKLTSVSMQSAAASYVKEHSLKINHGKDVFLYMTVNRQPKPKNRGSSGSGTHLSSSGRTHGGSSGKF